MANNTTLAKEFKTHRRKVATVVASLSIKKTGYSYSADELVIIREELKKVCATAKH